MKQEITNRVEALTLALKLAVQAPTQAKSDLALMEAIALSRAMSDKDVSIAKRAVESSIEYERQH